MQPTVHSVFGQFLKIQSELFVPPPPTLLAFGLWLDTAYNLSRKALTWFICATDLTASPMANSTLWHMQCHRKRPGNLQCNCARTPEFFPTITEASSQPIKWLSRCVSLNPFLSILPTAYLGYVVQLKHLTPLSLTEKQNTHRISFLAILFSHRLLDMIFWLK